MVKNKVQEFLNEIFGNIRVEVDNEELWFCATDIAKALNYTATQKVTDKVEDEDKGYRSWVTPGGVQNMVCINESGIYDVVISVSKKDKERYTLARKFKRWLVKDVIPSLRKDGMYVNGEEDVKSVEELQTLVDEAMEKKILRKYGIGVRKDWSKTIYDNWEIKNHNQFATYTNQLVYIPIFGKTASQLKKEHNVKKLRDDLFTLDELAEVAKLENEICNLVEFGADYYAIKDHVIRKYIDIK